MSWFSSLSVRGRTLSVGLVLTAALVAAGSTIQIPYVAIGPGLTINTLGTYNDAEIFTFGGTDIPASVAEKTPEGSHLNMLTVSVTDGMTLFGALGLWASGNFSLVPREEQFPPGKTVEEVQQENAKSFEDSQSLSEIVALRYLKYPEVTYVGSIPEGSPSVDVLDPQDQIVALNDEPVSTVDTLRAALSTTMPGDIAKVTVKRTAADGTTSEVDAKVTLTANAEVGSNGFLGISAAQRPVAPFTIANSLATSGIGGPSAGMMFTLGIIDRLTPGDLASGHFVAGTGEIDETGKVGPIGGILLKMISARNAGATYFLAPADNCAEALTRIPAGLTLVRVATVTDAMTALEEIKNGQPTTGC
jgi:PDZ domain-containing protein